jgi:hypothetical protein
VKTLHILNLGAGVQSTVLYLMSHRQDEPEHVPRFDCAIFADTQEEPRAVYEHLEWLKSLGGPPILTATAGGLGDNLTRELSQEEYERVLYNIRFNRYLDRLKDDAKEPGLFPIDREVRGLPVGPERAAWEAFAADPETKKMELGTHYTSIPAFTAKREGFKDGITRRQCTREYKVDVIEEAIRRDILNLPRRKRFPADVWVVQYMGLSRDEAGRIARVKPRFQNVPWAEPRFPLFDLEMTRGDCIAYLESRVPHPVSRSACVFCPYRRNADWRQLRDTDAEGWRRAVEIDERLRRPRVLCGIGLEQRLYLHESCVPLKDADIERDEPALARYTFGFAAECEGMCGV